jgi:hypothetical protein
MGLTRVEDSVLQQSRAIVIPLQTRICFTLSRCNQARKHEHRNASAGYISAWIRFRDCCFALLFRFAVMMPLTADSLYCFALPS